VAGSSVSIELFGSKRRLAASITGRSATSLQWGSVRIRGEHGYSAREMVGQHASMLAPRDRPDEIPRIMQIVAEGQRLSHFRTVRVCKDGSMIPVSLTVSPIKESSGRMIGASMIARDITERVRSEEEMRRALEVQVAANEELQHVNAIKSDFVSVVSHEFRTPLTVIQGFSEMISQEELGLEVIRDYASDIYRQSFRLSRMINDMLDLDRMESGKMSFQMQPIDLNALIGKPPTTQFTWILRQDSPRFRATATGCTR
jgi:PAS domain S-box-containing protein